MTRAAAARVARTDLAVLVETEAQLDRALADARDRAAAIREMARARAVVAAQELDGDLGRERARIADEIEAATEAELVQIADEARRAIARYDAAYGARLDELARRLAARVAEIAMEVP